MNNNIIHCIREKLMKEERCGGDVIICVMIVWGKKRRNIYMLTT